MVEGKIAKRNFNSKVTIGNSSLIEVYIALKIDHSEIHIKDNIFIEKSTTIDSITSVCIDRNVLIPYECLISDSNNHSISYCIRKNDLTDCRKG
jgi:acetyltransferase-like isoleucine patch superfamily enzyme